MKMKYEIDFEGLTIFLKSLDPETEIDRMQHKPITSKLLDADAIQEVKGRNVMPPAERLIDVDEPFLVDVLGNDLSIIILTKTLQKQPKGRKRRFIFVKTIIEDCHKQYGTALNGYWKIPSQFLTVKP